MSVTALLGLQWGDEGKGKVVDVLSGSLDISVRAQGGANAGHTVIVAGRKHVLHLIPSGMLYPQITGVIGNGVVVDPLQLVTEIDELQAAGCDVEGRLVLSDRAHLVMPYHKAMDVLEESSRGAGALGTTRRGIGPAYEDKAARRGLRAGDLASEDLFMRRVREVLEAKSRFLPREAHEKLERETVMEDLLSARRRLVPLVRDSVAFLHDALDAGKKILLEGAQGTLLDLDLGTYPFVTSSSCQIGGLLAGSGLPPRSVERVIGVAKTYCTRVGAGPFPTELEGPVAESIRERGREFGSTTGRPRRCGWFDAVAVRYAIRVNGVSELALTKLDVLADQPEIGIATGYELGGRITRDFPAGEALEAVEPVYERLEGFSGALGTVRAYDDLPEKARRLVEFISERLGVGIALVSTGPDREETVIT